MTLPASGQIAFSQINVEIAQAYNYSSSLSFLNNLITQGQSAGAGTGGTGVAVPKTSHANYDRILWIDILPEQCRR